MKKILLMILAVSLPLAAGAQTMTFRQLQEKYVGQEGYAIVEITEAMLKLVSQNNDKNDKKDAQPENLLSRISGIKRISIITATRADEEFVQDMKSIVNKGSDYKLLTSITEGGQSAMFYYKELPDSAKGDEPPRIAEFVMILHGPSDNLVMQIHGDFSIKQISSIADKAAAGGKIEIGF